MKEISLCYLSLDAFDCPWPLAYGKAEVDEMLRGE
jgi:hypothetical protein